MAGTAQNPTFNFNIDQSDLNAGLATWALTTANTDGVAFELVQYTDVCIQAVGTWGGATLTIQGSNDGTNWFSLTNAAGGSAATFTADGGKQVIERPRYIRCALTTPGVGASITAIALVRRTPAYTH